MARTKAKPVATATKPQMIAQVELVDDQAIVNEIRAAFDAAENWPIRLLAIGQKLGFAQLPHGKEKVAHLQATLRAAFPGDAGAARQRRSKAARFIRYLPVAPEIPERPAGMPAATYWFRVVKVVADWLRDHPTEPVPLAVFRERFAGLGEPTPPDYRAALKRARSALAAAVEAAPPKVRDRLAKLVAQVAALADK